MRFYPTALLAGLLLAFLVSDLQNTKAIDKQVLQAHKPSTIATRLVDSSAQLSHRGSGRRQFLWEATLSNA